MAIVNVSLDTKSRQVVLTINGILVPFVEVNMSRWFFDGEESINFSYTTEGVDADGMKERRQFFLPDPADAVAEADINEDGFASKAARDDEKAKADIIDYLKRDNKPE